MNSRYPGYTQLNSLTLSLALASTSILLPVESVQASGALEEIIVTARKRTESLQDVPVVVNVLTEDAINSQRIEGIVDIALTVPSLHASRAASATAGTIFLRGIGTGTGNPAFDQAVAINIDGMGINSLQLMNAGMFDLRQIEVLKGPQALFFGKNSPGGVIAIHTKDPGDEFELELTGMYETVADEKTVRGIISGPITDTLGARLAVSYSEADDFWMDYVSEDRFEQGPDGPIQTAFETDTLESETIYLNATLLWEPSDNFSANLKLSHLQDNEEGQYYGATQKNECATPGMPNGEIYPNPASECKVSDTAVVPGLNPEIAGVLDNGKHIGKTEPFFDNENNLAIVELDWAISEALSLTSVTGYFDAEDKRLGDVSFQIASGLTSDQPSELEQWSQELRLTSNYDGNVNFMLGAFYEEKEIRYANEAAIAFIHVVGVDALPVFGNCCLFLGRQDSRQDSTAYSVFGQLIWDIGEQWTLSIGGRYSYEEKEIEMRARLPGTPAFRIPELPWLDVPLAEPDDDWNNFSPEATLSYHFTDDVMFFASYREGFKSGGYDLSWAQFRALDVVSGAPPLDNSYDEETVEGFEVGMKSTLLDGTLRFNVTAFAFDYEDLQLTQFEGEALSFRVFNGGEASIEGVEVESLWSTPVDGLTLTANLAFGNYEFDDFIAPCYTGQTIALGCDQNPNPTTGAFTGTDQAGVSLPFASDLEAALGLTYDIQLSSNWNLGTNVNAKYSDGYHPNVGDVPPGGEQDSYWWVNAGLSLYSSDGNWEIFVRGNNLTDEILVHTQSPSTLPPGGGDAATTGTNDASGVPDFISSTNGGRQISVGLTYRM